MVHFYTFLKGVFKYERNLMGEHIDTPENLLSLESTLHMSFDQLEWWLEPVDEVRAIVSSSHFLI